MSNHKGWTTSPSIALRVGDEFNIDRVDRASTPGWHGSKKDAEKQMKARQPLLAELQERLFANGRDGGDPRRVLVVLQGMDSSGKGGIARHVMGQVDPQGVAIASFGVPTKEELSHDFLWRVRKKLPASGKIGLFDRSHYEDVLVGRVDHLADDAEIERRYGAINDFEKELVDSGYTIIKIALLISNEYQAYKLLRRLARRDKWWKYSPGDVDARAKWDEYQAAYQTMFERTSTDYAPWYAVPADNKWYPRVAVSEILTQKLAELGLRWPQATFSPEAETERILATLPRLEDSVYSDLLAQAHKVADKNADYREKVEGLLAGDAHLDAGERVDPGATGVQ